MARAKKTISDESSSDVFNVSLKIADKIYKESGATLLEAFNKLKPASYKTLSIITVESEGKKSQMIFYVMQMRRFLNNETFRQIWAKRMGAMLK